MATRLRRSYKLSCGGGIWEDLLILSRQSRQSTPQGLACPQFGQVSGSGRGEGQFFTQGSALPHSKQAPGGVVLCPSFLEISGDTARNLSQKGFFLLLLLNILNAIFSRSLKTLRTIIY